MEKWKKEITLGEVLYWLFWGSLLFAKGIGLYDGQKIFKVILIVATLCLLCKICIEEYTITEYIYMAVVIGLTAIAYLSSGEKGLLLYGLMMIGIKYVDLKKLFWLGTVLWGIAFFGTTVISLFHIEDTVYKIHAKLGLGHIFRWSLGYPHPNVLHVSYMVLAMFVVYILGENFKLRHGVALFVGNCLVFLYSVSYTGFIIVTFLLCGRVYLLWRKRLSIVEKILIQLFFPICIFASIAAPIMIKGELFLFLNELLSTRMELAWRYLKPEYISLFGIKVAEITTESLTMDNSYLSALITYGIVPSIAICVSTIYMIYMYLKKEQYIEVLLIISVILGGMTEPFLYNTSFKNLSFLFMGTLFFNEDSKKKKWAFFSQGNRKFKINTGKIENLKSLIKKICVCSFAKHVAGILCAILVVVLVNCSVEYPPGYVFFRTDCADLTKKKYYYEETDQRYSDYKKMGNFETGDEVEFFGGNIVKLEKVRRNVSSAILGYGCGYIIIGIADVICQKKEKNRENGNE